MSSGTSTSSPSAIGEVAVWEAFRGLRTEGTRIHAALAKYLLEQDVFAARGSTLEIGGGDGELWRAGGDVLLRAGLDAGRLVITDADAQLIETCRAAELFRRDRVVVERANVDSLAYPARAFARVIVIHVLHWCQTPERLRQAIREIARVLEPPGRALIVTVDERIHMAEVYELMKRARAALQARGVACDEEIPSGSPRVLPFCAGNAMPFLEAEFNRVLRVDRDYAHLIDARHPILPVSGAEFFVGYLRTLPFVKEAVAADRLPEPFFAEAGRLFHTHLAEHGVFRMSRRDVIYDCSL